MLSWKASLKVFVALYCIELDAGFEEVQSTELSPAANAVLTAVTLTRVRRTSRRIACFCRGNGTPDLAAALRACM
jgi:hypothetical protein